MVEIKTKLGHPEKTDKNTFVTVLQSCNWYAQIQFAVP